MSSRGTEKNGEKCLGRLDNRAVVWYSNYMETNMPEDNGFTLETLLNELFPGAQIVWDVEGTHPDKVYTLQAVRCDVIVTASGPTIHTAREKAIYYLQGYKDATNKWNQTLSAVLYD